MYPIAVKHPPNKHGPIKSLCNLGKNGDNAIAAKKNREDDAAEGGKEESNILPNGKLVP
jgi:hypothetical protein